MRPQRPQHRPNSNNLRASLLEGWRYFQASRDLKFLAATMAVSNLGTGIMDSMFITAFTELYKAPATLTGAALTLGGLAAVLGSKVTHHVLPNAGFGKRVALWLTLMLLGSLVLLYPSPWTLTLGVCIGLFATSASNVITIAYRRKTIPEHLQGRVNANVRLFITGALPVAGLLFGDVAHQYGVAATLYLVSFFSLLSLLLWGWYVWGTQQHS
ncbi:hypothetical protein ACFP81_00755 [Deinococcus lacus]|uniref:MFS transporter n=1 Tax=Deinococcus lacus TaxID=392561 RepID=A0ABW1Y945_9DEIO